MRKQGNQRKVLDAYCNCSPPKLNCISENKTVTYVKWLSQVERIGVWLQLAALDALLFVFISRWAPSQLASGTWGITGYKDEREQGTNGRRSLGCGKSARHYMYTH